jgi:hypothetical protein
MLAFALAIPGDDTFIYQFSTTNAYKVWGAWNTAKQINTVTIINKIRGGASVNVDIEVPFGWTAKRISLEAPGGLTATSGFTLAGMYYDVNAARLVGNYREDILESFNGRASVNVGSESLSIVFISAVDIGNVLQPALDGTVTSNDMGEIDVTASKGVFEAAGVDLTDPGSKILGSDAMTRCSAAASLVLLVMLVVF